MSPASRPRSPLKALALEVHATVVLIHTVAGWVNALEGAGDRALQDVRIVGVELFLNLIRARLPRDERLRCRFGPVRDAGSEEERDGKSGECNLDAGHRSDLGKSERGLRNGL